MKNIIYEDNDIIVVHKSGGIPVQTARLGQKDMVSMLKNYRAKKQEDLYIAVIHRLDQPVEGVLLFAKTKEAAAKLSSQSKERDMDKYYHAVAYNQTGKLLQQGTEGTLTDFLLKDTKTNTSKVVNANTKNAKKATLQYKVISIKDNLIMLSIKLETGRHHQIRVQMANAGMPLIGDQKYGLKTMPPIKGVDRNVALCSVKIGFVHPKTNKKMEFEIEPENKTFAIMQGCKDTF
ncbi:MAG: RluA family pseudouridine synthase [Lachnospiraceae bacterium]|nr:RluA family pseudouridine synthase [Lachnospiraceae bacterium]